MYNYKNQIFILSFDIDFVCSHAGNHNSIVRILAETLQFPCCCRTA